MRALLLLLPLLLSSCIAKTVVQVETLPVRASVGVVKAVAPNQAKADRKRGKAMRKAEERAAKERKQQEADTQ